MNGDISLSSVSADPSLDLSDGGDDYAADYSSTAASALQLGTEITAAISGVQPVPAVVYAGPLPNPAYAPQGQQGKMFLWILLAVIAIVVVMNFAD